METERSLFKYAYVLTICLLWHCMVVVNKNPCHAVSFTFTLSWKRDWWEMLPYLETGEGWLCKWRASNWEKPASKKCYPTREHGKMDIKLAPGQRPSGWMEFIRKAKFMSCSSACISFVGICSWIKKIYCNKQ